MITTEKLKATKITLNDEEGKSTVYVYGKTAKEIIASLDDRRVGQVQAPEAPVAAPKRRGRKPKNVPAATPGAEGVSGEK